MKKILRNQRKYMPFLVFLLPGGLVLAPLLWLYQHVRSKK
jgi:hypothetical protein